MDLNVINFITSEERYVLPTHGVGANYLAIESNASTRSMYKKLGIKAIDCMREGTWSEIPSKGKLASNEKKNFLKLRASLPLKELCRFSNRATRKRINWI